MNDQSAISVSTSDEPSDGVNRTSSNMMATTGTQRRQRRPVDLDGEAFERRLERHGVTRARTCAAKQGAGRCAVEHVGPQRLLALEVAGHDERLAVVPLGRERRQLRAPRRSATHAPSGGSNGLLARPQLDLHRRQALLENSSSATSRRTDEVGQRQVAEQLGQPGERRRPGSRVAVTRQVDAGAEALAKVSTFRLVEIMPVASVVGVSSTPADRSR